MTQQNTLFDCLSDAGIGRPIQVEARCRLFSQGEKAETLYVLQNGRVKLAALTGSGKQVIVDICRPGDLIGEESVIRPHTHRTTAMTMEPCSCLVVHGLSMLRALHDRPDLLDAFLMHVLRRSIRLQGDIASDRAHSADRRLARILLKLAGSQRRNPDGLLPKVSHEELAEMVGTTRPRITQFLAKMKETGYILNQRPLRVDRKGLEFLLNDGSA